VLLAAPGKVVSRDELSHAVLGRDALPLERSLDMQISRLRRKLGPYADGSDRIRSIRGEGYMYIIQPLGTLS
jgi:two-component system response regulator CpxR